MEDDVMDVLSVEVMGVGGCMANLSVDDAELRVDCEDGSTLVYQGTEALVLWELMTRSARIGFRRKDEWYEPRS